MAVKDGVEFGGVDGGEVVGGNGKGGGEDIGKVKSIGDCRVTFATGKLGLALILI